MAVVDLREVVGRSFSHKFGSSPTASRKFTVTLDNPATPTTEIINAVGISHYDSHPEYPFLRMLDASVSEGSPSAYHAEVTCSYEVPEQQDPDPNPLARADVWSFSTGGAAVPCFWYYEGSGNGDRRSLVNSAKDFFEGAMTEEAECRASISGNRASFPLSMAIAVTNTVNSGSYLGGPAHSWKCGGISAQQATEVVNDVEIRYWQITVELAFRQTGWKLLLPDIGYNYLEGGQKKRAYVLDPEDGTTRLACANPVALSSDGSLLAAGTAPTILERRVHREVDFSSYFGTPPF